MHNHKAIYKQAMKLQDILLSMLALACCTSVRLQSLSWGRVWARKAKAKHPLSQQR